MNTLKKSKFLTEKLQFWPESANQLYLIYPPEKLIRKWRPWRKSPKALIRKYPTFMSLPINDNNKRPTVSDRQYFTVIYKNQYVILFITNIFYNNYVVLFSTYSLLKITNKCSIMSIRNFGCCFCGKGRSHEWLQNCHHQAGEQYWWFWYKIFKENIYVDQ